MRDAMMQPTPAIEHARRGFTLLEIMIALLVVAILAGVALAWNAGATEVGDNTAVHADMLRLVASLQEARAETGKYPVTSGFTASPAAGLPFQPSRGIQYRVYGTADQLSVYAVTAPAGDLTKTCTTALGSYDTGSGTTCSGF